MSDAPEIRVKLTAEDAGVSAAIKELTSQLKTLKTQQDTTAGSSLNLAKAFEGIAVGAAAFKLLEFGKSVFEGATQIARASQITGASAQMLGVFHKAAGDLGIGVEVVDKSFVKLSKSILSLQQGSSQSVQAFGQLGLSAKSFVGLNTDQKIKLVVDQLGAMAAGTNRAALAQVLLGRGGAEALPIFQSLAGDGFAKAREEAEKLGILFDSTTANSILGMKKQMEDMKGEAEGAATQFEVGLIPAITDAAGAMMRAIDGGGSNRGFKQLGEEVGNLVKDVTYGLIVDGAKVAEIFAEMTVAWDLASNHMKLVGKSTWEAIKGYARGGTVGAVVGASAAMAGDPAGQDAAAQIAAIQKQFEAAKDKANIDVFGGGTGGAPTKPAGGGGAGGEDSSAGKAHLSLLKQQLDQELALYREFEKVRVAMDQQQYDKGQISLKDYFAARRAEVVADHQKEIQILESQKAVEKKEPADTEGAGIQKQAKIQALDAKIAEAKEAQVLKLAALETEQFKAEEENQLKILEFHKLIDATQGKTLEAAKQEIAIEQQKLQIILAQAGMSQRQIDKELAQYAAAKTALAEYDAAKKKLESDTRAFEIEKQAVDIKAKAGLISSLEKEREINDLIRERLPMLRADAAAELSAAQKTGDPGNVAAAQTATQGVQNLSVQTDSLQAQVRGSLTTDFNNFFMGLGRNTASAGDQFRQLAASIIQSLQQIILKKMLLKALGGGDSSGDGSGDGSSSDGGGGGGGGLLGMVMGLFSGHAAGGLIQGPGGPKSDLVPAMLSHGEFVMKADAVKAIGPDTLAAMNRGINIPAFAQPAHFSAGGLVGAGAGGGGDSNINLGISLDEGLILKHLESKAAGNVILNHLANNPKAAKKLLSRGD
jgi:hypothetical protein